MIDPYFFEKMELRDIVIDKIRKDGPVCFRDFMEMALYYPQLGYYNNAEEKIGTNGDFFTSSCVSSLFGEMIAKQIEEMWILLGKKDFTILEFGAGKGQLCVDILRQLASNPSLYEKIHYCIIEKSESMRAHQQAILPHCIKWYKDISEVPSFTGCIISNEVVDNFSVHQVKMQEELMEVYVDHNDDLMEKMEPAAQPIHEYAKELKLNFPKGYRTEINTEAIGWMRSLASVLQEGFIMTIDYGYPSATLYNSSRSNGTLTCYHRHRLNYDPYHHIGEQDITAHVNFSALRHWGSQYGLHCNGFTSQGYFLMGLGIAEHARKRQLNNSSSSVMPLLLSEMGSRMKVLIQSKGFDNAYLSGLRFPLQL